MIKISIIVPVYNSSKYLEKCIQSLTKQTLKDIEIIFIDDGSTDNSVKILEKYAKKDSRITILKQNHKRQGAARNYGLSIAKGNYIGFVDSDDWVELNMFEKMYDKAIQNDSDITVCSKARFYEDATENLPCASDELKVFKNLLDLQNFESKDTFSFIFNISVSPWNKIYKRKFLLDNNLNYPEDIYFEDNVFFLNSWLKAKRINVIDKPFYIYRKHANSTTGNNNDKNKLDIFKILELEKNILIKNDCYNILESDFLRFHDAILTYWLNQIKNPYVKSLYFIKMFLKSPKNALSPLIEKYKALKLSFILHTTPKDKILFWGYSKFLDNFLKSHKINNKNIVGIIDKDSSKTGKIIENIKVFSTENIQNLLPARVIITIMNFNKAGEKSIQKILEASDKNYKLEIL